MKILFKFLCVVCLIIVPILASAAGSQCMERWLESPAVRSQLAADMTSENTYDYPGDSDVHFHFKPLSDGPNTYYWFIDKNRQLTPIALYIKSAADACHCSSGIAGELYIVSCMRLV